MINYVNDSSILKLYDKLYKNLNFQKKMSFSSNLYPSLEFDFYINLTKHTEIEKKFIKIMFTLINLSLFC